MNNRSYTALTALLGVILGVLATLLAVRIAGSNKKFDGDYNRWRKLNLILQEVERNYVDTIDMKSMTDAAVVAALAELDPHTVYLPLSSWRHPRLNLPGISKVSAYSSMCLMTRPLSSGSFLGDRLKRPDFFRETGS